MRLAGASFSGRNTQECLGSCEVKATHKMERVGGVDLWELHDSHDMLYFRTVYPYVGVGIWCKSVTTLDKYLSDNRFAITKLNTFKGNK